MGGAGGMAGMGGAAGMTTTSTGVTTSSSTGSGGTGGASGGGGTAGAGATTDCVHNIDEASAACSSCNLNEGEDPPGDAYLCGEINGTGPTGLASVLENGRYNAVAVAAFDRLGNVGKLSVEKCATPTEVQDFYEEYRARGGKAGGGICSVPIRGRSPGATGPLLGALACAALVLRRRRRAHGAALTRGGAR
jgi:hypothetical protein